MPPIGRAPDCTGSLLRLWLRGGRWAPLGLLRRVLGHGGGWRWPLVPPCGSRFGRELQFLIEQLVFDAWFFEAAGVGMHLPSPGWLAASRRSNRRRKRGGLSFGAQGGPGLRLGVAGRLCANGSRDGDRAVGHASGHNSVGLHSHRRHGRTCMPMPRGDDKTSQGSCQNTDRMPRLFGPEHQQSTKTSTSDFSTTSNLIEMIQKPMVS